MLRNTAVVTKHTITAAIGAAVNPRVTPCACSALCGHAAQSFQSVKFREEVVSLVDPSLQG